MTDDLKQVGNIEINQDLDFQRAEWKVQRTGWVLMLLIAAIALVGGLGQGPLSNATARGSGDLVVKYERVIRHAAASHIIVHFDRSQGEIGVAFPDDYLEQGSLESITPEPSRTESGSGTISYFFQVKPKANIQFEYHPQRLGSRTVRLTATNGAVVQFRQFVLP